MNDLPPPFTSISEVLTSPPERSENHIFTKLAQEPFKEHGFYVHSMDSFIVEQSIRMPTPFSKGEH